MWRSTLLAGAAAAKTPSHRGQLLGDLGELRDDLLDLSCGKGLLLVQLVRELVEASAVVDYDLERGEVALVRQLLDGHVDLRRQVLRVARTKHTALVDGDLTDARHADLGDHRAGDLVDPLQVLGGVRGHLLGAKHNLLRGAAAEEAGDSRLQGRGGDEALVLVWREPGEALLLSPGKQDHLSDG